MPRDRLPPSLLSEATQKSYAYLRTTRMSPRVKMAARMYASAAVSTQREASRIAGLHPQTFSMYMRHNEELQAFVQEVDDAIGEKSIDMSAVLQALEVAAVAKMKRLMDSAGSEQIQFKAAQDLLDRGPRTGKIQRQATVALSIDGEDAKALAASLLAARQANEQFRPLVQGDYEKVHLAALPEVTGDLRDDRSDVSTLPTAPTPTTP